MTVAKVLLTRILFVAYMYSLYFKINTLEVLCADEINSLTINSICFFLYKIHHLSHLPILCALHFSLFFFFLTTDVSFHRYIFILTLKYICCVLLSDLISSPAVQVCVTFLNLERLSHKNLQN